MTIKELYKLADETKFPVLAYHNTQKLQFVCYPLSDNTYKWCFISNQEERPTICSVYMMSQYADDDVYTLVDYLDNTNLSLTSNTCSCPKDNFTLMGRGCVCGGK
jgi:hypothetical protein